MTRAKQYTDLQKPSPDRRRFMQAIALSTGLLALAFAPTPVAAGIWSRSLRRALSKKVANSAATSSTVRPAARGGALTAAEEAALRRQLATLDRKALDSIVQRYGQYIAPERLRLATRYPTKFRGARAYQDYLRRAYPNLTTEERSRILGNYKNLRPHVDRNQVQLPRNLAHERIHQLADPRFARTTGGKLNEGMTEHFARRIYGDLGIKGLPKVYPQEQRVIRLMADRVGDQRLAQAYFRGDVTALRHSLDKDLGRGTFDSVVRAMERGDFSTAAKILQ